MKLFVSWSKKQVKLLVSNNNFTFSFDPYGIDKGTYMSLCTWLQTLSDLFLLYGLYGKLCSLEIQIQGTVVGKAYKTMLVFSWLPNQIISLILIFGLLCQSSYFDTQMTWEIYYSNMLVGFMVNITEMLEGKSYCLIYDHKIDVVV